MKFDWDAENTKHIGLHEVERVEAEQVLRNDPVVVQYQAHDSEDRILVLGQTNAGRLLAVVYTERRKNIRFIPTEGEQNFKSPVLVNGRLSTSYLLPPGREAPLINEHKKESRQAEQDAEVQVRSRRS